MSATSRNYARSFRASESSAFDGGSGYTPLRADSLPRVGEYAKIATEGSERRVLVPSAREVGAADSKGVVHGLRVSRSPGTARPWRDVSRVVGGRRSGGGGRCRDPPVLWTLPERGNSRGVSDDKTKATQIYA